MGRRYHWTATGLWVGCIEDDRPERRAAGSMVKSRYRAAEAGLTSQRARFDLKTYLMEGQQATGLQLRAAHRRLRNKKSWPDPD
jgi:hypothetical protein